MSTLGVDVQFGGNLGVLQREEVYGGVFDMHGIVLGLDDEGGRRFVGDMDIGVGREVLFGEREVAGIDDHGEVRAAAELVSGIDRLVEALIEMSAESGGEMRSCGKAEDADAVWVDVPLGWRESGQCRPRAARPGAPLKIWDRARYRARDI